MSVHRNIRLLTWFSFFQFFSPYSPFAVIYFAGVTGSYARGLSILAIMSVACSVFELPTGILSDAVGRKRTMLLGSLSMTAAIVLYALGGSYWMLALGAVFAGFGDSLFSGNNDALLYESVTQSGMQDEYATRSGKMASMSKIGAASSAALGGLIATWSLPLALWFSAAAQLVCVGISMGLVEPASHRHGSTNVFAQLGTALRAFRKNRTLRTVSLVSILSFGIGETINQSTPVFIALFWPPWALGIARMLGGFFGAVGFWVSGTIIKRLDVARAFFVSAVVRRAGGIIAYIFPTVLSPLLIAMTSFPYGVERVAQGTLLQREFSDAQRATMGSLNSFLGNILFAVFAVAFGALVDALGSTTALLVGELLLLPVLWLSWSVLALHGRASSKV